MIQKLPFYFPPISNCYSACAGVASILQAYDVHNPALFLNRLYLFRKTNNILKFATLEKTPGITLIRNNKRDICKILTENLENNNYVFVFLDHFYISKSSSFQLRHFIHDVTLIYGFDSDRKIFFCADNFSEGKYLPAEVTYDEFKNAWENVLDTAKSNIVVFKYDTSVNDRQLDFYNIFLVMQDYLDSSTDHIIEMNPDFLTDNIFGFSHGQKCTFETCVLGIKIFEWLLEYLGNEETLDLRPLHLLINHQEILLCLMKCVRQRKRIPDIQRYLEVLCGQKRNCEIARNMAIKYNMSPDQKTDKRIQNIVARVYDQEKAFYCELLSDKLVWDY